MNTINRTVENIVRRSLSALLAVVMVFSITFALFASLTPAAKAGFQERNYGSKSDAYNTLTIYKWRRVHTQGDLPPEGRKVPVLLMWKGKYEDSSDKNEYTFYLYQDQSGSNCYHAHGEDALKGKTFDTDKYGVKPFDANSDNDVFYTLDVMSNITVKMNSGRDKSNQDAKYGKIWFNNWIIKGDGDFDWGGYNAEDAKRSNWSFYTKELDGKYAAPCTDETPLQIYYERSGWYDTGIRHSGQWVYAFEDDTYSYGSFAMYWGEQVTVSAITDDYTVYSGMVMNIDNGVLIEDGVTVTVMPGGVLSVEGQLYNNGTIKNYGTVVLQPDSCISCFLPESSTAGAILNSGEVIDTSKDISNSYNRIYSEYEALERELESKRRAAGESEAEVVRLEFEKESKLLEADSAGLTLSDRLERLQGQINAAWTTVDERAAEIEAKAAEDMLSVTDETERYNIQRTADEEIRKLEDDNIAPLEETYNRLYQPILELENRIGAAKLSAEEAQTFVETNTEKLNMLDSQRQKLSELRRSGTAATSRGEGNLIVMRNARIIFNNSTGCTLTVRDGGSCVCGGYIVLPRELVLDDGKLQIRRGGAMAIGYYFKYGIINAQSLTPTNPDTMSLDFSPMYEWVSRAKNAILASGDYVVEVDGVLKYCNESGVYNTDLCQREAIYLGGGVWSTTGSPKRTIDENGVETNVDSRGNETRTYPDGTTEYYNAATGVTTTLRPNGNTVVLYADGSSVETWPDGESYIKRFADGSYQAVNVRTAEYEMVLDGEGTLSTVYAAAKENGLKAVREYRNGEREEEFADGRRVRYNAAGNPIADYAPDPSGKLGTYTYADRVEVITADGLLKSVEYTAGLYSGARIVYDPLDESVRPWQERSCIWTVRSAKGDTTKCYAEQIDGRLCSVICFANGKTCTFYNGEEEADASFFTYDSSLWLLTDNSRYQYDANRRVITLYETKTEMADGTTRYERSDGTFVFCDMVNDAAAGAQREAVLRIEYPSGATVAYEKSYYEKTAADRVTGELLWMVRATNGDTATARIFTEDSGYVTVFFTGTNGGKTKTFAPDNAPKPENYLASVGAASYDEPAKVLPMPELGAQDMPDGGVMQTYTDGVKRITYSGGDPGEGSDNSGV